MDIHSQQIIGIFYNNAKQLPGLYDLLLRGTGSKKNISKLYVEDWSDLDFSIIVKELNFNVIRKVKELYKLLTKCTDIKITITLVDLKDFFSNYHLHGIKSLAYTRALKYSESLLRRDINYADREFETIKVYKCSSYFYLAYLIHDLRNRYIICNDNIKEFREFFKHFIKRSNHIIVNALFLKSGLENVSKENLLKCYPKLDQHFLETLSYVRNNWQQIKRNRLEMQITINYIFDNIESLYSSINSYIDLQM